MSYTLRLLTEADRDLVVEALDAEADKRTRVARGAAMHVAADRQASPGKDVRSASVRVAMLLAEAGQLADLARELRTAVDVPLVAGPMPPLAVEQPAHAVTLTDLEEHIVEATAAGPLDPIDTALAEELDDGLSPAAHAAMAAADEYASTYLADPDDPSIDTGALGEDEPAADDVEEVLPHE